MRVRVKHETRYRHARPVAVGPHVVRLRPAAHARARVLSYNLAIEPESARVHWQYDPWSNRIARVTWPEEERARELSFLVELTLDIQPVNPFDFFVDDRCEHVPFEYPDGLDHELAPFVRADAPGPRLAKLVEEVPLEGHVTDWLVALNRRVASSVRYVIREEAGIQDPEQTLEVGSGSCRDSALVLVAALRARGLAARFVSGYLVQLTDEGIIPDLAKGVAKDVVDLHAWAEVYVPGGGWVGLDGTSGLLCGEGHVPLACTVSPELAAPITGTAEEAAVEFVHSMSVERLGHEPRPRKPYTDEQWALLLRAGDSVDEMLESAGLELTVGGEPTWTSREHREEPEWDTEAVGPTKAAQGARLAGELAKRFGTGTLVLHRMGKHYPGESLPRWALHLLWREDGEPIWRDPALFEDDEGKHGRFRDDVDGALQASEKLAVAIGKELGLTVEPMAAFEDPLPSIVAEQNLPPDLDPHAVDLRSPEERLRLSRLLARGLDRAAGYGIPIRKAGGVWVSGRWDIRRERVYLLPGDSPMGLRLPLDRIAGDAAELTLDDTTTEDAPLAPSPAAVRRPALPEWAREEPPKLHPLTTLCVEPRGGVIYVFVPPVGNADDFLEITNAIETATRALGLRVRLEGYAPPSDHRLRSLLVTPDPGVIEVNAPVCRSVREYAKMIETVQEAAIHAGLTTEKYRIDGREVGSGGGNHITLGGPAPYRSPFLTRPDIVGSVLTFIQHHPSISFLFTGIFVGPTSQAPRVDEARHDALAELELALAQVPKKGEPSNPWQIDRLLRNLLVDVSGNTHRTEMCIDKLFDPSGPAGRQGLLEFRAFEMPPHERMATAQVLLLRALVARVAKEPYSGPLVRWGTRLHDEFMLPTFLWSDFEDVLRDLSRAGVGLDPDWYRPFLDFRCPKHGVLEVEGVELELRAALEPWPTLGELAAGSTVARGVDSSLERLEVKVRGLVPGRHTLAVNGVDVPLRPTGRLDEGVCGVRFRAWQPPMCLHPSIPVHHPLRFDLVDTWGKRSLGACTYHVWHPEGRAFEEPPLTAFEAAARRAQRFTTEGHARGPVTPVPAHPHPEHPYTLDLRWFAGRKSV